MNKRFYGSPIITIDRFNISSSSACTEGDFWKQMEEDFGAGFVDSLRNAYPSCEEDIALWAMEGSTPKFS